MRSPARILGLLALAALWIPTARADEASATKATLPEARRKANVESFEIVWKTIRDKHYDPKLGGLNWQSIHDELRPKIEKAETMAEARAVMGDLIGRLKLSHFGILPADVYDALEGGKKAGDGASGIEARVLDGKPVVFRVEEGSPAAKAGVKPGWIVAKIEGKDIQPALDLVRKKYDKSNLLPLYLSRAVAGRLGGDVGETVAVDFLDGKDQPVKLELVLARPTGNPSQFGNLPTMYVKTESKTIAGDIRYFSLSSWFDLVRVVTAFRSAVESAQESAGMIIDIRGNPGGIGAMAMALGGFLVEEPDQKLGTMTTREGSLHFTLNPRTPGFTKPVAILIDGLSLSTSEIFSGGLKDLKRARIFGERTGGAALPSTVVRLPNGDGFQYAFANYISKGGKPLEGLGVSPDAETPLTRAALLEGRDPALDEAVRWIHSSR